MRRIALLTTVFVFAMAAASCKHDGRTLRDPKPDQNYSISTTAAPVEDDPGFDDPGALSTINLEPTLPPSVGAQTVTAPWRGGAAIDSRYTCDGLNIAPALSWTSAPVGTAEIAISMTDLDAPGFVHWVIAGISPQSFALNEDTVPIGAYEATNGLGDIGYTGPCPPAGTTHTYSITVHYLGAETGMDDGVPASELVAMIASVETAVAEVSGTFSRS